VIFLKYFLFVSVSFAMLNAMSLTQVNKATKYELMMIKGIGDAKADAIISSRPFKSMQQLDDVNGIGEVMLGNIQNSIYKKSATKSNNTTQNNSVVVTSEACEDEPKRKKVNVIHFEK
jgi:competence protein ComEA